MPAIGWPLAVYPKLRVGLFERVVGTAPVRVCMGEDRLMGGDGGGESRGSVVLCADAPDSGASANAHRQTPLYKAFENVNRRRWRMDINQQYLVRVTCVIHNMYLLTCNYVKGYFS